MKTNHSQVYLMKMFFKLWLFWTTHIRIFFSMLLIQIWWIFVVASLYVKNKHNQRMNFVRPVTDQYRRKVRKVWHIFVYLMFLSNLLLLFAEERSQQDFSSSFHLDFTFTMQPWTIFQLIVNYEYFADKLSLKIKKFQKMIPILW